jgi:glutamate dehydrogenase (NAD(P)+)
LNQSSEIPDAGSFAKKLAEGAARFNALEPELQLSVRDPQLGVEGHVVVWCTQNAIGGPLGRCGKGGTRIAPSVTLDEVRMLARTQSLKNAAAGLPLGGAKSGLAADPDAADFEIKYRRFVQLTAPALRQNGGPWGGFGFDIGARPVHAEWACHELGHRDAFTGKPLVRGGTDYDKEGIAGLGVAVAAVTMLAEQGTVADTATAAVQGLGAMGAAVCRYAVEAGIDVVAIADPRIGGCWRLASPLGGDLLAAVSAMDLACTTAMLEVGEHHREPLDTILTQRVDVLFPCAVQNVIREDNAGDIQATAIVEGANNPVTPAGRIALHERGVTVIPDIIANSGGAIAAFVEMTSEVSDEENRRTRAKAEEAKRLTREKVAENVRKVLAIASAADASPVDAAHYLAYERIFGQHA